MKVMRGMGWGQMGLSVPPHRYLAAGAEESRPESLSVLPLGGDRSKKNNFGCLEGVNWLALRVLVLPWVVYQYIFHGQWPHDHRLIHSNA